MLGRVGRHEGALRDHSFLVTTQRFEHVMREPRSVSQAGRSLEQDDPSIFDLVVRDCERAVPRGISNQLMERIVLDAAYRND